MNELIPLHNATELVVCYHNALNKIQKAMNELLEAKIILKNTFGKYHDCIIPQNFHDSSLEYIKDLNKTIESNLIKTFWQYIVEKTEMKKLLSIPKQEEMDKQLYDKDFEFPEPTIENVFSFLQNNLGKANEFFKESIQIVFEWLRPNKDIHKFKTNEIYEIGHKVLRENVMEKSFGNTLRINHHGTDKYLTALDNIFYILDNKQTQNYPNDLVTIINNTAGKTGLYNVETEYFKLKWYKKGSLHIEFKRLDLLTILNQKAGGNHLKYDKS